MKIEVYSFFYMGSLFTSEKIPVKKKKNRSQPESKSVLTYQEIWSQSRHSETMKTFEVLRVFLTNGIWRYIKLEKVYLFPPSFLWSYDVKDTIPIMSDFLSLTTVPSGKVQWEKLADTGILSLVDS